MIEFELDGKTLQVQPGATILEVALSQGKYIPHFCYHKCLSVAANCRMCLVEVEKSAKPLPACATPITQGMKVNTCSKLAQQAQQGVMELLLINHPLDCPVCDQGGECQLQDLSMGYGEDRDRFYEAKRAVTEKNLGPLITTNMTRCIHCSRCVRFSDEVAGYQELGMSFRNNHVEVMPFIEKTVDSELSGNMIDICPVGALTATSFKFNARSWELSRRKSISSHDALGSNIIVQVDKYHKVVRVLPFENSSVNGCWLSDRDRFSYEGLYHQDRLLYPMIKQHGEWVQVDWDVALSHVAHILLNLKTHSLLNEAGIIYSGNATCEEMLLLHKIAKEFGIKNIDYRLTQCNFALDGYDSVIDNVVDLESMVNSQTIILVASSIRDECPLLAERIRYAVAHGTRLHVINLFKHDVLCPTVSDTVVDYHELLELMLEILLVILEDRNLDIVQFEYLMLPHSASDIAKQIAKDLSCANILLGAVATSLPNYSQIKIVCEIITKLTTSNLSVIPVYANQMGGEIVTGTHCANAQQILRECSTLILFNTELELDAYNSAKALLSAMTADNVIVMSPFISNAMRDYANVILPIATSFENSGTFVNMFGKLQEFNAATKPGFEIKPAWRVLRVLSDMLSIHNCLYVDIQDIRQEFKTIFDIAANHMRYGGNVHVDYNAYISATKNIYMGFSDSRCGKLTRIGVYGIYDRDSLVRRAASLQKTNLANRPCLLISEILANKLMVNNGDLLNVKQDDLSCVLQVTIDKFIPSNCVFLMGGSPGLGMGGLFDSIDLERYHATAV